MGKELNISDTFFGKDFYNLGIAEMITTLTRCFCILYLIFVSVEKVKKAYLYFSIFYVASFVLIGSAHFAHELAHVFLIVGMVLFGIGRGSYSLPFIIASAPDNIDGREHPTAMNIWLTLTNIGDVYGLLISLLVIYVLEWNWSISLFAYTFLFGVSTILEGAFLK